MIIVADRKGGIGIVFSATVGWAGKMSGDGMRPNRWKCVPAVQRCQACSFIIRLFLSFYCFYQFLLFSNGFLRIPELGVQHLDND